MKKFKVKVEYMSRKVEHVYCTAEEFAKLLSRINTPGGPKVITPMWEDGK